MLQQDKNRLLPQVKQEEADRDNCNLDLKVEVNISSGCSLSPGEWLQGLFITFTANSASSQWTYFVFSGRKRQASSSESNESE